MQGINTLWYGHLGAYLQPSLTLPKLHFFIEEQRQCVYMVQTPENEVLAANISQEHPSVVGQGWKMVQATAIDIFVVGGTAYPNRCLLFRRGRFHEKFSFRGHEKSQTV